MVNTQDYTDTTLLQQLLVCSHVDVWVCVKKS